MVARRSIRSMYVEFLGEGIGHEAVHAHAGSGENLIDQRYGVRFAPHVLLHEFFCLATLRTVQDLVHV